MGNERKNLNELFSPRIDWKVEELEKESVVDGTHVLGRVLGEFFVPDGESRNKRFYSESLWRKALGNTDFSRKMSEKKIFGTIGHDEEPITEEQLRKGEVSHLVTKLWIEEGADGVKRGMGEAIVLNTPTGRNLNTYLRAGCRLNTSSRASGSFAEGKQMNGVPVVDEDSYVLETFDFVLDPGFIQARPDLVEQLNPKPQEDFRMEDNSMGRLAESSLKALQESRDSLQRQLTEAITAKSETESRLALVTERLQKLSALEPVAPVLETLAIDPSTVSRIPRIFEDLGIANFAALVSFLEGISKKDVEHIRKGRIADRMRVLEQYQKRVSSTPEIGVKIGQRAAKEIEAYRKIGTASEISEKLNKAEELKRGLRSIGSITEARRALTEAKRELDAIAALGTRQEIEEALRSSLSVLTAYKTLGTPARIRESLEKAEKVASFVEKLGGKKKIVETLRKFNASVKKRRESALSTQSESLSSTYQIPVDKVRTLVESVGAAKAEEILSGIGKKSVFVTEENGTTKRVIGGEKKSFCESFYRGASAKLGQ